ncbi:MAG: PQQ-binding-like beta-propeller repeat protein [Gemmatimonadetes bacterium]|nr:PQQ-binding-like beta-propeller repeat protein [Gemmatimonadota bacterium]
MARPMRVVITGACALVIIARAATAQVDPRTEAPRIFAESCAECHSEAQSGRTPSSFSLGGMTPRAIVAALETGAMRAEGAKLSTAQRIAIAEYLTGREHSPEVLPAVAFCANHGHGPLDTGRASWMGYGGNLEGTGFQPAERAGLRAEDVPGLELRWAFGFPDAVQMRTKPTVIGDVLLVGGSFGEVFAIEAASGCVRWTFAADAAIRGAILVGRDAAGRTIAYFVDFRTSAYALDVGTGELLWKTRVGWHPENNTTGSPALHDGGLIVPVSSMEVVTGASPAYPCCTSSGAVAALDVVTGDVAWYHRVIGAEAREVGRNAQGTPVLAPSGAPVWSSPTIDVRRGVVYVGTGENYTRPATTTSDAILAIDLSNGALAWSFQGTSDDAYTMACSPGGGGPNCPDPAGPDLDFGMAPMRVTRTDGREILVVGQKSGVVWALDPDAKGAVLWSTRVGKGSALGGIHWGMATDGRYAYAANADRPDAVIVDVNPERAPSPGLFALDLMTGQVAWSVPAPACARPAFCYAANSAAPTVIPGVVFAGGLDGHIRAHAAADGRVLWDFDTAREFATVNGVPGRGGAIDGPGPVIANGMVFVNSGYGLFGQMAGNVLLAFAPAR